MSKPRVYDSMAELVKGEAAAIADPRKKHRAYRGKAGGVEKFIATSSPGQAALAICEVELIGRPQMMKSAFEVLSGVSYPELPFEEPELVGNFE